MALGVLLVGEFFVGVVLVVVVLVLPLRDLHAVEDALDVGQVLLDLLAAPALVLQRLQQLLLPR